MPIESEIKFTVPDKRIFNRVASLKAIAGYKTVDKGVKPHTDTCFDTRDFLLFRGQAVFRLRRCENESVLTFKFQGTSKDNIYRRIEIEHKTDASVEDIAHGHLPDIPPVKALYEHMGSVKLAPSLTVSNRRRIFLLTQKDIPCFELVLDDIMFSGPGGERGIYELEIESLTGSDDSLKRIGAWLAGRFDLKHAGPSKYILGMKLVGRVSGL